MAQVEALVQGCVLMGMECGWALAWALACMGLDRIGGILDGPGRIFGFFDMKAWSLDGGAFLAYLRLRVRLGLWRLCGRRCFAISSESIT